MVQSHLYPWDLILVIFQKSKLAQRGHTYASTAQRAKLENLPRTRAAPFWIKWQLPIFFLLRIEIIILSRHFFQNKYTVHTLCVAACSQTGRGRSERAITGRSQYWSKVEPKVVAAASFLFDSPNIFWCYSLCCLQGDTSASLMELATNIICCTISHFITPWPCLFIHYFLVFPLHPPLKKL